MGVKIKKNKKNSEIFNNYYKFKIDIDANTK